MSTTHRLKKRGLEKARLTSLSASSATLGEKLGTLGCTT